MALADAPALQPMVERLARQHKVCALAFVTLAAGAVADSGVAESVAGGCGAAQPLTAESVFQAASLSKTVFAYAVLKLAAQGRLSLDKPLVSELPQGYFHRQNLFDDNAAPSTDLVTAPELAAVTARMVLRHTSGLPNWSPRRLTFDFQPGSAWQYSGEAFMLLQRAVEAATGQTLDALMQREVFEPLGMASSSFRWQPSFADRVVPGMAGAGRMQPHRFTQPLAPASLYTTAHDFALFLAALLNDAPLLRSTVHDPVAVDARLRLSWGLGWGIEQGDGGPFLWQWGNNPGFRAFAMASATSGDGFVLLTNSERGLELAAPLAQAVLPGDHPLFKFRMLR